MAVVLGGCAGESGQAAPGTFDVLIRDGRIVDGTGNPWFRGDVGIRGARIAAVGDLGDAEAARVVNARGRIVSPGFIDMHSHTHWNLFVDSRVASKVTQGITLDVAGEGTSVAPVDDVYVGNRRDSFERFGVTADWRSLADFFQRLEANPAAINFATYVGTGTLRELVVGTDDRPASEEELAEMERLTAEAMEDGALGVYSALMYVPDRFNSTEELIAVARVAARHGGVYQTHQRSEGNAIFASLEEVFRIAREAEIPVHITHLKTAYHQNWREMPQVVERIAEARNEGLDVTADIYPYTWGSAGLRALLPPWAREGDPHTIRERLRDATNRERIRAELAEPTDEWENEYYGVGGAEGFRIVDVRGNEELKWMEGKGLGEISREEGSDPRDVIMDIIIAGGAGFVSHLTDEEDMRFAMRQEWVAFGTDGGNAAPDGPLSESLTHPRAYGTYPRILGRYVRELDVISLAEAIRKSTSLPAQRLGLRDRGLLREGFFADLVVFDARDVMDRATYEAPHRYAAGVDYVVVNGQIVVDAGRITDARPGRPVRGPGYRGGTRP